MQTIARANRVFGEKNNGLIVDYIGVFRDLQAALAIYGSGGDGAVGDGEWPVQDKSALVGALREAINNTQAFCAQFGVALKNVETATGFGVVAAIDAAVEALIVNDESKRTYLSHASRVDQLFKAILPDASANEFGRKRKAITVIAERIRTLTPEADIDAVMDDVEELLDASVAADSYVIRAPAGDTVAFAENGGHTIDLSRIDFDALARRFANGKKRTEAERLRALLQRKLTQMVRLNKSRLDYLARFQQMIDAYNSGATDVDLLFEQLTGLAQDLSEEDRRHIVEQLSEEELAVFDLLMRPRLDLSKTEELQVKEVARALLQTLKEQKLVLDWRRRQQTRAAVRLTIEEILDRLPERYTSEIFAGKCDAVYQHVFEHYFGAQQSAYNRAA